MVSEDKLIKTGIKYTDALFEEITRRLTTGIKESDTLEGFLENTREYTTANPLITTGYDSTMIPLILSEINNHKFSRPSTKELTRITIEQYVGDLIRNVGEDMRQNVRDIVKAGYDEGLNQYEIADNITKEINSIKKTRANAIARTEIARTASVSDYIINKERGATHYTVECRNDACPICKEKWLKKIYNSNQDKQSLSKNSIKGDVEFSILDTSNLPPIHPNCRCVARFKKK